MWDSVWIDAELATMAGDGDGYGTVRDGAVGIAGGRIAWVGRRADLPEPPNRLARVVCSAEGGWITPGLIDCHTHLVHGGDRAGEFAMRLAGRSYEEIARAGGGIRSTVAATRAADEAALLAAAERRLAHLLAEGVTVVEVKSGYGLDLDTELKMLRVATALGERHPVTVKRTFLGAHAVPAEFHGRADAYVDLVCDEVMPAAVGEGLVDAVDAFCERIAFSVEQTRKVFEAARDLAVPIKLHAEQLSLTGGAALAAAYGALSCDHLEHLDEAGVREMAAYGTVAVLLPGAFYFLGETRKPPVALLRRHGVPIAIATDSNPGSSPATSLLLMLNMGCVLFGLTPAEALAGVTREAARALGMEATHGTLAVGKAADLAVWRVADPAELSYRIGFNPLATVVRQGRVVSERPAVAV